LRLKAAIERLSWVHTMSMSMSMSNSVAVRLSPAVSKELGAWKPFLDMLKIALRRTCEKWKIA